MSESLTARPYQTDAIEQIKKLYFANKKNVLLHMATGGGKTFCFSMVMKGVHAKGNRAVLAVKGRELVDNASQRLFREGVPHGVLMSNHWNKKPHESIQVCSIDTVRARGIYPPADLVVVDEAHHAISKSYRTFIDYYKSQGAFLLSVTATPHVKEGLRHLADDVVYPITIRELIAQGYLMPPKYYAPPSGINFSDIRTDSKTGDYNVSDLAKESIRARLAGDIVKQYKLHADGRPAVLFAVTVEHSLQMVDDINAAGINAVHIDASSSDSERKKVLMDLERGDIKIVSNVGILCTGVDMPYVSAIIMARATHSYNLFIQQIGRGTRPYPGKKDFIVLDHANNINEHGVIEHEKLCNLDGTPKKSPEEREIKCSVCYHVWLKSDQPEEPYICYGRLPNGEICLHDNTPIASPPGEIIVNKGIDLISIENVDAYEDMQIKKFIEKKILTQQNRGHKPGWVYYKILEKYGKDIADKQWRKVKARCSQQVSVRSFDGIEFDWDGPVLAARDGNRLSKW